MPWNVTYFLMVLKLEGLHGTGSGEGVYNVRLEREHLYTFTDTLIVAAGKTSSG